MAKRMYVATVQVVIELDGMYDEAGAADWFSGLLTDNDEVFDWAYLKLGAHRMYPSVVYIDKANYEEGEAFS